MDRIGREVERVLARGGSRDALPLAAPVALLVLLPLFSVSTGCGDDPPCEVAECGPTRPEPLIVCDDDSIGGDTGRCLRNSDTGTCGWELRVCPPTRSCAVDVRCPSGFYCGYTPEAMCGAGGASGICKEAVPPDHCTNFLEWVCGCDGVTYLSSCDAATTPGIGILHTGFCSP